jgi:molybdopterin molybdotransferase
VKLLSVDEARARMLAAVSALAAETVPLAASVGRILAQDVAALRDQPPFDASAMDGWALRAADAPGSLAIVGESAAGHGYEGVVGAGQAVRIFTGAALPEGCDAVVIQEDAQRDGDRVVVPEAQPGKHLRPAGGDFRRGEALLSRGARIDPWRLSLAASAGCAELSVHRRPRVAVIPTGEEIVEAPASPGRFQIYESCGPALTALVESWGGVPTKRKAARDDLDAVVEALRGADADLIVTIGGASVGDHDLVRAAGEVLGLDMRVESVAIRPGKPTFFGVLADGRRMLGLPGNPASALVCAELFLKPLLLAFQGADPALRFITARLTRPLPATGPREHWLRAGLSAEDGVISVTPYGDQDSSLVSIFALADALLRRPAGVPASAAGDVVEVLALARS